MSAAAADRLAEIQARADNARQVLTSGTTGAPPNVDGVDVDEAIDILSESTADVPRLVAGYRKILDLHKPVEVEPSDTICRECSYQLPNGRYFGKVEEWPCPTVRAVENALGEAS